MKKISLRHWKILFNVVTIGAILATAFALRHQINDTIAHFGDLHAWILLLAIPLEAFNYFLQSIMYGNLFQILGQKFKRSYLYKVCLELNFINTIFPSGGVSGFSYISLRLRRDNVSPAKATLVQMMRFALIFVSFQLLLFIGLIMLTFSNGVNNLVLLISGSLATCLLFGTVGIAYMLGSRQRINKVLTFITKILNKIIHIVRPNYPETINIFKAQKAFNELHDNFVIIKLHLKKLKVPLLAALLANLTEITVIYIFYVAYGHWQVNPGAIIIGYAIANFAGLISVLPGGVGIYEALMTGVLATAGVSPSLSLPVTVTYRIVNMVIQLPPGYVLYHRALHAKEREKIEHE